MVEIVTAIIGALSLIAVAIVEKRTRRDDQKWEQNTADHNTLAKRVEDIGSNLGRSLDRVESNLGQHISRIENKIEQHDEVLFGHLTSHAEMALMNEPAPVKRRRNKQ